MAYLTKLSDGRCLIIVLIILVLLFIFGKCSLRCSALCGFKSKGHKKGQTRGSCNDLGGSCQQNSDCPSGSFCDSEIGNKCRVYLGCSCDPDSSVPFLCTSAGCYCSTSSKTLQTLPEGKYAGSNCFKQPTTSPCQATNAAESGYLMDDQGDCYKCNDVLNLTQEETTGGSFQAPEDCFQVLLNFTNIPDDIDFKNPMYNNCYQCFGCV